MMLVDSVWPGDLTVGITSVFFVSSVLRWQTFEWLWTWTLRGKHETNLYLI